MFSSTVSQEPVDFGDNARTRRADGRQNSQEYTVQDTIVMSKTTRGRSEGR